MNECLYCKPLSDDFPNFSKYILEIADLSNWASFLCEHCMLQIKTYRENKWH